MEIVFKDVKNPKLTLAMARQEIKIPLNMAEELEMINRIILYRGRWEAWNHNEYRK